MPRTLCATTVLHIQTPLDLDRFSTTTADTHRRAQSMTDRIYRTKREAWSAQVLQVSNVVKDCRVLFECSPLRGRIRSVRLGANLGDRNRNNRWCLEASSHPISPVHLCLRNRRKPSTQKAFPAGSELIPSSRKASEVSKRRQQPEPFIHCRPRSKCRPSAESIQGNPKSWYISDGNVKADPRNRR